MADTASGHAQNAPKNHAPIFIVVGLLLAGLLMLVIFGVGAKDRVLDRSAIGVKALAPWMIQAGIPTRSSHPRLHPRIEDVGLRVLPLYDIDLFDEYTPPETKKERLKQASLRDLDHENFTIKIIEVPSVVLLPKWNAAMIEIGIAHERSLIPIPDLQVLLGQIDLDKVRLQRGGPEFTSDRADGDTLALFHAQLFDPRTLPETCEVDIWFGQEALAIACDQEEADFPVYIVADPDFMNNHGLALADNASVAPKWLARLRIGTDLPVYIDKSPDLLMTVERDDERQDYERGKDEFARFFDYPFSVFWAALLIVLACLFWRGAIRFGPVRADDHINPERSKRAVITAKARLLRLSGSDGRMVSDFVRSELQDLAARSLGSEGIQDAEQRFLTLLARRDPDLARDFGDVTHDLMQNAPDMSDAQLHRHLAHYHSLLTRVVKHYEPV